jgi:hypothetical protein
MQRLRTSLYDGTAFPPLDVVQGIQSHTRAYFHAAPSRSHLEADYQSVY